MKKIDITIPLRGLSTGKTQVSIKTEGFAGKACQEATRKIQEALGGAQVSQPTGEMYQQETAVERLKQS